MNYGTTKLTYFVILELCLIFLWGTVSYSDATSCITVECHSGLSQHETVHSPIQEKECLACHKQVKKEHPDKSGGAFTLVRKGAELCYQCHDDLRERRYKHQPVREGDCLSCHRPHGSAAPFLLDVGENQRELCFECHDSEAFEQEYGHGPVSLGVCTYCHSPHSSSRKGLLKEDNQALCLGCHADFAEGMQKSRIVHSAVSKQSCVACHNPHGSSEPRLLKQTSNRICFQCHADIDRKYRMSNSKHTALYKEERCGNCHTVHFAEQSNLLFKKEIDLCLGCHDQDDYSKNDAVRNVKKEIEGKEFLHGPVQEGNCSMCHDPHGGEFANLMRISYPAEFYAPYRKNLYAFCFECHDGTMLTAERTKSATDFRNGEQNLHFLHVSNERKGRSCRACHEPHASDGVKLISKKGAVFGSWRVPIRFELSENGGSCMPGCHRKVGYDRKRPVDYKE